MKDIKVHFSVGYNTVWGQQVALEIRAQKTQFIGFYVLDYLSDGIWSKAIELPDNRSDSYEYGYVLVQNGKHLHREATSRVLTLESEKLELYCYDQWRMTPDTENTFNTSAFADVVFKPRKIWKPAATKTEMNTRFVLRCTQIPSNLRVGILGDLPALGKWEEKQIIPMYNHQPGVWSVSVLLPIGEAQYKYVVFDPETGRLVNYESGENREIFIQPGSFHVVHDDKLKLPVSPWKGAGVATPVFSIRTDSSLGVGDFVDLRLMVDWAKQSGLQMVQILPVNDTIATKTWTDSYPYAAISVFALHPLYLNIEALPGFSDQLDDAKYELLRSKLNELETVDYEAVLAAKLRLARQLFDATAGALEKDKEYATFLKANKEWLLPYAAFCRLRDTYETVNFEQWGEHATYSKALLKTMTDESAAWHDDIVFYCYLQYHLDKQLAATAEYARRQRVVLKGDIPIGIYRYSVDAWVAPRLYNMDGQAGAPPDAFAVKGQNWGFPTYNWQVMEEDGFAWWKKRFQQLGRYFDSFRIDHILGFFRIWQVPLEHVEGILGFFNPAIAFTEDEIKKWGISFTKDRFVAPFISANLLATLFGEQKDWVITHFLEPEKNPTPETLYRIKTSISGQKGVLAALKKLGKDQDTVLKQGLFDLVSNVLFIEDTANPGSFHPRINLQDTQSFAALSWHEQQQLLALHNDYFYQRQEDFWYESAMRKLPAIRQATNMLICGEDLGMVPACVPPVMDKLEILTLEIQRMAKKPETEFLQNNDIPYLSVASPSTHDMDPVRAWWESMDAGQRQRFYQYELGFQGQAPLFCEPYIAERILKQHLSWNSLWVVFPLQDFLAIDGNIRRQMPEEERINEPSNPTHYWRFRFHLSMETLLQNKDFSEQIRYHLGVHDRLPRF